MTERVIGRLPPHYVSVEQEEAEWSSPRWWMQWGKSYPRPGRTACTFCQRLGDHSLKACTARKVGHPLFVLGYVETRCHEHAAQRR